MHAMSRAEAMALVKKENAPAERAEAAEEKTLIKQRTSEESLAYEIDVEALIDALKPITSRMRKDVVWRKANGQQSCVKEPLTHRMMAEHITGSVARGLVPMMPGESTTRIAMLDLDSHKGESTWDEMVDAAVRVTRGLESRGIQPISFRSSGGRGIHMYALWDDPQDAYSVRELLNKVITESGFSAGTKGVRNGEIEIFPKQNRIDPAAFGSQWILPLAGKSVPLDPLICLIPRTKADARDIDWTLSQPVPPVEPPAPNPRGP